MRVPKSISGFIACVSMISLTVASPCKPYTTLASTTAPIPTTYESTPTNDITSTILDTTLTTVAESAKWTTESQTSTGQPSTSVVPQPTDTFRLVAANSGQTVVNGETLKFKTNDPTILSLKPSPDTEDQYETGHFSLEPLTNRLMLGDRYVVYYQEIYLPVGTGPETSINFRPVVCESPPTPGQPLSCTRPFVPNFKWMVKIESDEKGLFIRSEQWGDSDQYDLVDMIVS